MTDLIDTLTSFTIIGSLVVVTCALSMNVIAEWDVEYGARDAVWFVCLSLLAVWSLSWRWVAAVLLLYLVVVAATLSFEKWRRKRVDDT